jgi:butyryl-CoA dehydrogenase
MLSTYPGDARAAHASAVPYLELWGVAVGGWQMARAAKIAVDQLESGEGNATFLRAKIATARYYAECLLPQADALAQSVVNGSTTVLTLSADQF